MLGQYISQQDIFTVVSCIYWECYFIKQVLAQESK